MMFLKEQQNEEKRVVQIRSCSMFILSSNPHDFYLDLKHYQVIIVFLSVPIIPPSYVPMFVG